MSDFPEPYSPHKAYCCTPTVACEWYEVWSTQTAAKAAVLWHMYENHPFIFTRFVGEHEPSDYKPDFYGVRVYMHADGRWLP